MLLYSIQDSLDGATSTYVLVFHLITSFLCDTSCVVGEIVLLLEIKLELLMVLLQRFAAHSVTRSSNSK